MTQGTVMWVTGLLLVAAGVGVAVGGPVAALITVGLALVVAGVVVDVWGER